MTALLKSPDTLRDAISNLYRVFGRYTRPPHTSFSEYAGISNEEAALLTSRPLRDLQPEHLTLYAMKAVTTWGDVDEFRHYLPRILELIALYPDGWIDVAGFIARLDAGNWCDWPQVERDAVLAYCSAFWRWLVNDEVAPPRCVGLLLGASRAGVPLAPLLEEWAASTSVMASKCLSQLIGEESESLLGAGTVRRWKGRDRELLNSFLRSEDTKRRLEADFFRTDPTTAQDISAAVSILEQSPPLTNR
jgi:hypothetical protein